MGARWVKIAAIYLFIGVMFGLFMHYTLELQWASTHAHINVVGWLTTGLIGAIYSIYPLAGNSMLGKIHFWLHNIGLPFLLAGMLVIQLVVQGLFPGFLMEIFVSGGGIALFLSIIVFIINMFINVKASTTLNE